jgi:hypothetical protein
LVKRLFIVVLLLSFGYRCAAQGKIISIPMTSSGDTSLSYQFQTERFAQIGLSSLVYSTDSLVLRFSTEIQAVEIRTADFKTFSGYLYNFTTRHSPYSREQNKETPNKLLFNKTALNKKTARQIYETFEKLSISDIPSEEKIKGRSIGSDGMTYIVENATPSTYSFKTYWEPSITRNRMKEVVPVDDFFRELRATLDMYTSFDSFVNSLPAGTYHAGGILTITTSKETKKRSRKNRH